MQKVRSLLVTGKQMDASCINQHIVMVTITAVLTLVLVVQTKTNSLISVSMTFTLESRIVE
jgi:hypothetical protein